MLQLVIIVGSLYVLFQALTKWSELALDAEYGEFGLYLFISANASSFSFSEPYTSSVETWWNRKYLDLVLSSSLKYSNEAFNRLYVPIILV